MDRVIFACVHNAGRSQMAAAFFAAAADPSRAQAVSAGTQPGDHVHPVVRDVMREVGIDVSNNRPRRLTDDLSRNATLLITMGCGDECPYVPGLERDDWPLTDPKNQPIESVRKTRDDIRRRVDSLVESRLWAGTRRGDCRDTLSTRHVSAGAPKRPRNASQPLRTKL